MKAWGSTWDRIRENQAKQRADPPEQTLPDSDQHDEVSVTRAAVAAIGERMWYDMTDDDCRLRAGNPQTFAAYLERQLFPE